MIIIEIISFIFLGGLIFSILSTIIGKPIKYKYHDEPFVQPDDLPNALKYLFNFLRSIPKRLFSPKEFKLKKLYSEKERLIKEIKIFDLEAMIFERQLENENTKKEELRKVKDQLLRIPKYSKEYIQLKNVIFKLEHSYMNSPTDYNSRQNYKIIKKNIETSKKELEIINNKIKNLG